MALYLVKFCELCSPLSLCPLCYSFLSAYLRVFWVCLYPPHPPAVREYFETCGHCGLFVVVVTLIGGLFLAFGGGGRHTKQLAMHGIVPPLENRPLRLICSVNLPILLPAIPLPSSLPGTGCLHHLFERQGQQQ